MKKLVSILGIYFFSVSVHAAPCDTTTVVKQAGGGDCTTISQCVALIPATLTGNFCIDIQDNAVYADSVTVQNIDPNGFQISIGALNSSNKPTVSPPASSGMAFQVNNSSVNIFNLKITPTNTMPYAIYASSDNVSISSINLTDTSGKITSWGVTLANWSSLNFSTIAMQPSVHFAVALNVLGSNSSAIHNIFSITGNSYGLAVTGSSNTFSDFSLTMSGQNYSTGYVTGDNNTITRGVFSTYGSGFGIHGNNNYVSFSTISFGSGQISPSPYALTIVGSSNSVTQTYFSVNARGGLSLYNDSYSTVSNCRFVDPYSTGLLISGNSHDETILNSSIDNFLIDGPNNIFIGGNTINYVLNVTNSANLATSSNTVIGQIFLDVGNTGFLSFSSTTVSGGPSVGVFIASQSASVSIASMTFSSLSAGATAISFGGGVFNSTFSNVNFADTNMAINVDASLLTIPSQITMLTGIGARSGATFDNDPNSVISWGLNTSPSLTGSVLGDTSVQWSWPAVLGALSYQVLDSQSNPISGVLSAGTLSYTENSLLAHTLYSRILKVSITGDTLYSTPKTIVTSGALAGCDTTKSVVRSGGGDCTSISQCVALIPSSLTGNYCIDVLDSQTYAEQVTLQNITNNGHTIQIGALSTANTPSINPPNSSSAGFQIYIASVSILRMNIVPTSALNYGIYSSSGEVVLSSVTIVDSLGGHIGVAGVSISSRSAVSYNNISVANGIGIYMQGDQSMISNNIISIAGAVVTYGCGSGCPGIFLENAVSNTLTQNAISNYENNGWGVANEGIYLLHSHKNTISFSSITCQNTTNGDNHAIFLLLSSSNTITQTSINAISDKSLQPTSSSWGIKISSGDSNAVTQSSISALGGLGIWADYSGNTTITGSTITANGPIYLGYSNGTNAVTKSALNFVGALDQHNGASGLHLNGSLNLDLGNTGVITLSSMNVTGNGFLISTQAASLSLGNLNFSNLTGLTTAIQFLGGTVVSTFSSVNFADTSIAININASRLSPSSRISMIDPSGPRTSVTWADDPNHVIDWKGPPGAPGSIVGTVLGISSISWTWSGFADGFNIYQASSPTTLLATKTSPPLIVTGLTTNSTYGIVVNGFNSFGTGSLSDSATSYTLAAPPTGSVVRGAYRGNVSLSWSANTNPTGTTYDILSWTTGGSTVTFSTQATFATVSGFPAGTTVYLAVQAVNNNPIPVLTSLDVTISTFLPPLPLPPTLSGAILGASSLQWNWTASTGTVGYQLFSSSGGAVSGILSPATLTFTETGLSVNIPYTRYIQAFNNGGVSNSTSVTSFTLSNSSCGTSKVVKQSGGGDCTTMTQCVGMIPASLTGDFCIDIQDSATYSEQVTVQNITTNSHQIIIGPLTTAQTPIINPPTNSTAAVQIANTNVTLMGIEVISTNTVSYGVFASSAFATVNGVQVVDPSGRITMAGISISSSSTVTYSSVNVTAAAGIYLPGTVGTTVSYSYAAESGGSFSALSLDGGASSNTIMHCLFDSPGGTQNTVSLSNASYNILTNNSITNNNGTTSLVLIGSSHNTINQSILDDPSDYDTVDIIFDSNWNTISQSTITCAGGDCYGVFIDSSSNNTVTQSYIDDNLTGGWGIYFYAGGRASSNTVTNSYIRSSNPAISLFGTEVVNTIIQNCTLIGSSGFFAGPSSGVTLSNNLVTGLSTDKGIILDAGTIGVMNFTSNTVTGSQIGLYIANDQPLTLSITSMTFSNLTAGATAIQFAGGALISSFSFVNFADTTIGANIDASLLTAPSRIKMVDAAGARQGRQYSHDPNHYVSWLYSNLPKPTSPAVNIQVSSLTVSYGLVGADGYTLAGSSAINFSGTLFSTSTTNASSMDLRGLGVNTTYYLQLGALWSDTTSYADTITACTLAMPPTSSALSGFNRLGATITWSANGNPTGTIYNVLTWAVGGSTVTLSTNATSAMVGNLVSGTTNYFAVRALNNAATPVKTAFDVILSTFIPAGPTAPTLSATVLGVSSITWSWTASVGATGYQLFDGSGTAISGVLSAATLSFDETGLASNTAATRVIQVFNNTSFSNSSAVTKYTLASVPGTIIFNSLLGNLMTVSWADNGNPLGTTYQLVWWVTNGSTVTVTTQSATSPVYASVGLPGDTTSYLTVRAANGDGILTDYSVIQSTFLPNLGQTISPDGGTITFYTAYGSIVLIAPPHAFTSSVTVTVAYPIGIVPPASGNFVNLGVPINFTVTATDSDGNPVQPLLPMKLIVGYTGATLAPASESTLVIARYETDHLEWVALSTTRDGTAKTLTVRTEHLSLFEMMGVIATTVLDQVTIGPNPLRPMLHPGLNMTFRNLPVDARVRIYTVAGDLLADLNADGSGLASWDGKNSSGEAVASGAYLAFVEGAGTKKILHVAVER